MLKQSSTVTILDVAKKSGYSKATVSMALNGRPGPKADTVAHVHEIARSLGFTPNVSARRLGSASGRAAKSMVIGFISDHRLDNGGEDPYHFQVLMGVQQAARASAHHVMVSMDLITMQEQLDYVRSLANGGVDGWVFADTVFPEVVEFLRTNNIPVVIAGDSSVVPMITSVHSDSIGGASLATQHLIGLGHRNIAFVGRWRRAWNSMRLSGYLSAMAESKLDDDTPKIVFPDDDEALTEWLREQVSSASAPTAIVAATDWIALAVLKSAKLLGISVPGHISVIGYDDASWLLHLIDPPLTTIRVPIHTIGQIAFRELHREIETGDTLGGRISVPVELVLRQSTAPPP